jgi:hypothetical protein
MSHIQPATLFDSNVPVVSWQILVLLKLYAGGPQDLADAKTILAVRRPKPEEIKEMSSLATKVGLTHDLRRLLGQ